MKFKSILRLLFICTIIITFFESCDFKSKSSNSTQKSYKNELPNSFDIDAYKIKAISKEGFFQEANYILSNLNPEMKTKFEESYFALLQNSNKTALGEEMKSFDEIDQMSESEKDAYIATIKKASEKTDEIWLSVMRGMTVQEVIDYASN